MVDWLTGALWGTPQKVLKNQGFWAWRPTFAVKNHGFCEVEGLGGLWRQGGTKLSNVPSVLAVFEEEEREKEGGGRA